MHKHLYIHDTTKPRVQSTVYHWLLEVAPHLEDELLGNTRGTLHDQLVSYGINSEAASTLAVNGRVEERLLFAHDSE